MALHYSDGSYVGGFPAFIGGLIGGAIYLVLVSSGLNIFLSLLIGAGIPIGVMALIGHTPKNYSEDIIGFWIGGDESFIDSNEKHVYSWEFKNDGKMIWDSGRWPKSSYNYEIKGKFIFIEGEKRFKIDSFHKDIIMWVVDCKSHGRLVLSYRNF